MRVLLTGGDGFIGRHLARGLGEAGHALHALVYDRAPGLSEQRLDLSDSHSLRQLPTDIDAIVHAAGVVDVRVSPERTFAVNLGATRNLLAWARTQGVRHFVHLSSVAVYGPLVLGKERTERAPRLGAVLGFPYMRSKARAELAVEHAGVPYTILRPAAVLGEGDSIVSPGFAEALSGPGIPLLAGASPRRRVSLTLAEGLVQTVLRVLELGPLGTAIHATDVDLTLEELAAMFAAQLGRPCRFAQVGLREVSARRADAPFQWLVASARFGQHYSRERRLRLLGPAPEVRIADAIRAGLSGLQGRLDALS